MQKYVVWGIGSHARTLLDNFYGLEKFIEVFLDNHYDGKSMGQISVVHPSKWGDYNGYKVVICVKNSFYEIYNELIYKYHCKKENIISSHEWICKLLIEKKIKLFPKSVRLETCTLCQLECTYCYMRTGDYGTMGRGYLKYKDFSEFIIKNPHIEQVEISNNGEVFLNPDLKRILLLANERGINITIGNGTNFNTVTDEMLELLVKTQVSFINISIDGASQEVYSSYRRNGNFNNVISNIKKLNNYKKKYNSVYPILQWQYILMPHNECDVEKASIMARELNMSMFYKYECVKGEYEPENRKKLEDITDLKYFSKREYDSNNEKTYGSDMCYQALFCPQINYDGRLLGCCMLWDEDFGINVFETGFIEALNSDKYLKMLYLLLGIEQSSGDMEKEDIPCFHCGQCGRNIVNKNFVYL